MSKPVRIRPRLDYLSNKNIDDFVVSNGESDNEFDFEFQYVSKSQFKNIVKDVRRQRTKKKDEKKWLSLSRRQDAELTDYDDEDDDDDFDCAGVSNIKKLMRHNMDEVDRELKRLKMDSLPEQTKSTSRNAGESMAIASQNTVERAKDGKRAPDDNVDTRLAIPRGMNTPSTCERSSARALRSGARRVHSEYTLRPNDVSPRGFDAATNDYADASSRLCDDSDPEDAYDVRPHLTAAHKILSMQKKISELLDEIEFRLTRISRPDGDCDLRRREQRGTEFAIRFSRNYLYELGRKISDLRRHVRTTLSSARVESGRRCTSLHMQMIEQKLTSAHQLLFHALLAYCKHVPSLVLHSQPGKFNEILRIIVELRDICNKLHLTTDYFGCGDAGPMPLDNDIEKRCARILLKLTGGSDNESRLVGRTVESNTNVGIREKISSDRNDRAKKLPDRFSMYMTDHRSSTNPGRRRLRTPVKSRDTRPSSVIPRTPPNHRPSTPNQPNSSPALYNSTREMGKRVRTKIHRPRREDEISTMMSTLDADSDAASSVTISGYSRASLSIRNVSESKKCFTTRLKPSLTQSNASPSTFNTNSSFNDGQCNVEKKNTITDQQLSSLVPVIADLMTLVKNQENDVAIRPVPLDSMQALMKVLKQYQTSRKPQVSVREKSYNDENSSIEDEKLSNSGESTVRSIGTIRGPKNMQLICCTSSENNSTTKNFIERKNRRSSKFDSTMEKRKIETLTVSESSMNDLTAYRNKYQCSSSLNPMYTNNGRNKPWDVVAWIADRLADELIVNVSEELQIKDALHQLFVLEFKEFQSSSRTSER